MNLSRRKSPSEENRREEKLQREKQEEIHRDHARNPVNRGRMQAEAARESFWQMKTRYVEKSLDLVARLISALNS